MMLIGLAGRKASGKSTVAHYMCTQHGFDEVALADPIKDGLVAMLGPLGFKRDHFDDPKLKELTAEEFGVSPRRMMQTLGTEWGRNLIDEDMWITIAEARIEAMRLGGFCPAIVVSDIRRSNEAAWIRRMGGRVWEIDTLQGSAGRDPHISEIGIAGHERDEVICNMGTLDELYAKVDALLAGQEI